MKDSWLRSAFSDTTLVAHLLLHLKHPPPPPQQQQQTLCLLPLPPSWGVRQPRSKQPQPQPPPSLPSTSSTTTTTATTTTTTAAEMKRRGFDVKESVPRRRSSPTTPLSWTTSGGDGCDGGGVSGGSPSDGYEYESLSSFCCNASLSDRFRSKVSTSTETPSTTAGKRPKRKKTFAELKEVESSILKERICLKKELATIRVSVKEQRSLNDNLKRIKRDLHVEPRIKSETGSVDDRNNNTSNALSEAASSSVTRLVLPDLNMEPEEDTAGMS